MGALVACSASTPAGTPSEPPTQRDGAVVEDAGAMPDATSEPAITTIALTASTTQVAIAETITLTAKATAVGGVVSKIDFYEGATLLGSRNASPATLDVPFVEGDNGTHTYVAKLFTPAEEIASSPLDVVVAIPPDPCGADRVRCTAAGCPPGLCLAPSHVPSGFGVWSRTRGIHDVALTGNVIFDTKTGAIDPARVANTDPTAYEVNAGVGFVRTHQTMGEPDIAVWVFSSLESHDIAATFAGDAAPVLAVTKNAVLTGGRFDLAAKGPMNGPGGFLGGVLAMDGSGCAGGKGNASGGGGAAFGSDGAPGGAGAGALASACESAYGELLSLRGGSGGGAGDDPSTDPSGGAGGGAFQISAFGSLSLDAVIHAGGGAGRTSQGDAHSGSGGGSGGAIFLESPSIMIGPNAGLYANGGGGGSSSPGAGSTCAAASNAQDGQPSLVAASGGRCGSGSGGDGASATVPAKPAAMNGGGGGGLGRIVLRTLSKSTPTVSTPNLSPGPGSTAYRVLNSL
jgi:hypothetical protein